MTTSVDYIHIDERPDIIEVCPGENLLKQISGKWKPQILGLAVRKPLRFNHLMRVLPKANKQSISVALKELEEAGLLFKTIVSHKPLHIEYTITEKGKATIPVFHVLAKLDAQ